LNRLIGLKANAIEPKDDNAIALHLAAENGHLDVFNRLLELKIIVTDQRDDSATALHLAAQSGYLGRYLLPLQTPLGRWYCLCYLCRLRHRLFHQPLNREGVSDTI
jgi:ankyrin repeat protein